MCDKKAQEQLGRLGPTSDGRLTRQKIKPRRPMPSIKGKKAQDFVFNIQLNFK